MDVYELLRQLADGPPVELAWAPTATPVVAVYSEKGGVGKTALVNGLAAVLGAAGRRVLVVDLDPRATATSELGVAKPEYSANDLLYSDPGDREPVDPRGLAADAVLPTGEGWPATVELIAAERALGNRETDQTIGMEQRLRLGLDGVAEQYDLVVIDVPPRPGGKLAAAAVLAATHVLLPATLDEDGYIGVEDALLSLHRTRLSHGLAPLTIVGILRNIVDRRRTGLADLYDRKLAQQWPPDATDRPRLLGDVAIPQYVVRRESRSACVPITAATGPEAELLIRAYRRALNHIAEVA